MFKIHLARFPMTLKDFPERKQSARKGVIVFMFYQKRP
jgi:hypothetical protein